MSNAVQDERCDECGSRTVIGLGCDCPPDGRVPTHRPASQVREEWRRFPTDTILISPTQYARRSGCPHLTEALVLPPRWGWIPDPAPGLWDRLGISHPAAATQGNTSRRAIKRCPDCEVASS